MRTAIIIAVAALAGCATWTHPTKGAQAFEVDRYQCERDNSATLDPQRALSMYYRCMRLKGWKDS